MIDSKKKEKIETLLENTFFDDSDKNDYDYEYDLDEEE